MRARIPLALPLAAALVAALALAGCSGSESGKDPTPTTSGSPNGGGNGTGSMAPKVLYANGTITFSAGTPVVSFTSGGAGYEFDVDNGTQLLFAEMVWTGPADLDLYLSSPGAGSDAAGNRNYDNTNTAGNVGTPDSPSTLTIKKPGKGGWAATPFSKGGAARQDFSMAFTLFYDTAELPAGYTALA